jgi:hypothetical protein
MVSAAALRIAVTVAANAESGEAWRTRSSDGSRRIDFNTPSVAR